MFTVFIPTQSELDYLDLCLKSLKKNTTQPYNVMIWDNGSNTETQNFIKNSAKELNIVKVRRSNTNLGISRPYNWAFENSPSEIVMTANNDYYFLPGWEVVIDEVRKNKYGWCSPHLIEEDRPARAIKDFFGWHPRNLRERELLEKYKNYTYPDAMKANTMNAFATTRSAFHKIGPLNEGNPLDEWPWLARAKIFYEKINLTRLIHPSAFIYHFRGPSRASRGLNSPRPASCGGHAEIARIIKDEFGLHYDYGQSKANNLQDFDEWMDPHGIVEKNKYKSA